MPVTSDGVVVGAASLGERLGAKSIDQQRGLMGGLGLIERTQWCGNRANPIYRLRRQI